MYLSIKVLLNRRMAVYQLHSNIESDRRNAGINARWLHSPSTQNLILSVAHSSFSSVLSLGEMRTICAPRVSITILLHRLSSTSMLSVITNSQGLAMKAYGFDVSAPTL